MPLGREKVKLQWQVAPLGTAFTASSGVISGTTSWTDTLPSGLTFIQEVSGLTSDTPYHPPSAGRLAGAAAVPPQPARANGQPVDTHSLERVRSARHG